jgi:hypothetical protein
VDPAKGWIDSWNNKPARAWRAADNSWNYGEIHRVQLLASQLRRLVPRGGVTAADVVQVMANAATEDLPGQADLPTLLRVLGADPKNGNVISLLRAWLRAGTRRIDRNGDGQYEHQAAVAFLDAWWPNLIHAMFDREMGGLYSAAPLVFDERPAGRSGSSYAAGYYGQVLKALQMALGEHVSKPYRVLRCADGTLAGCRAALVASIALTVKKLGGDPSTWNVDEKADAISYTAVGLIDVPDMPWQNRPTFQQVVQVTSHR